MPALVSRYAKGADSDATDALILDTHTHTHTHTQRLRRCRVAGSAATGSTPNQQRVDTSSSRGVVNALTSKTGGPDDNDAQAGHLVSYAPHVAAPLTHGSASPPGVNPPGRRQEDDVNVVVETVVGGGLVHSLTSEGSDGSEDGTGRGTPIVSIHENQRGELTVSDTAQINTGGGKPGQGYPCVVTSLAVAGDFSTSEGVAQTVRGAHGQPGCVVQPMAIRGRDEGAQVELGEPGEPAFSIRTGSGGSSKPMVAAATTVRRLTELECERLQGFPDQWTDDQSGAARYRQLGNTVAVPCVEWLVGRLVRVDAELYEVDA